MKTSFCMMALVLVGSIFPTLAHGQVVFLDSLFVAQRIEGIVYGTAPINNPPGGDFELLLDLYQPTGPDTPGLRPGFVIIHGGSFDHGSRNEPRYVEHATKMAERGYTAVSIDYRLIGQAPVISEEFIPVYQAMVDSNSYRPLGGAAAIEDATRAYRWLVDNAETYHVDTNRIAVGGFSAGAITSLGMAYLADDFEVSINPPIGSIMDLSGGLGSFVTQMETGESPLIIVHGQADPIIPYWMAEELVNQAQAVGIPYDFCSIAGAGHEIDIFTVEFEGETLFNHIVQFFYEYLYLWLIPSGVESRTQPMITYELFNNHPNPFNSMTTIRYELPEAIKVRLRVFDLAGRLVKNLVDGAIVAGGPQEVVWRGLDEMGLPVASGVYYYRLEAGEFSETKRMTLVK